MLTEGALYTLFAIIFVLCTTLVGIALLAWDVFKGITMKRKTEEEMPMRIERKQFLSKEKDDGKE